MIRTNSEHMDNKPQRPWRLRPIADAGRETAREAAALVLTGHAGVDTALCGGLAKGQLHELFACREEDAAAAAAMAVIFAERFAGPLLWLREERAERRLRLHGRGIRELAMDPSGLVLGILPDADAVLRASADALRCTGMGVVVIELWRHPRNLGLTATRRFHLAAKASGVTALMLRVEAEPAPSAAATRWSVRSLPSLPLEANAPGYPAFELELLRRRGGGHGRWQLEWDRDGRCLRDHGKPALAGALVSAPADRQVASLFALRQAG